MLGKCYMLLLKGSPNSLQVKYIKEKGKDNTWVLRYKLVRRPNQVGRLLASLTR